MYIQLLFSQVYKLPIDACLQTHSAVLMVLRNISCHVGEGIP